MATQCYVSALAKPLTNVRQRSSAQLRLIRPYCLVVQHVQHCACTPVISVRSLNSGPVSSQSTIKPQCLAKPSNFLVPSSIMGKHMRAGGRAPLLPLQLQFQPFYKGSTKHTDYI